LRVARTGALIFHRAPRRTPAEDRRGEPLPRYVEGTQQRLSRPHAIPRRYFCGGCSERWWMVSVDMWHAEMATYNYAIHSRIRPDGEDVEEPFPNGRPGTLGVGIDVRPGLAQEIDS
jgi:hypothetical protein